ncbi:MAG: Tn3 family transposase, partial [Variovorax paradoxus]
AKELHRSYSLSDSEIEWVNNTAKSPALSIGLAIQLKVFQQLHYFVPFEELPQELISHVRQCLRYGTRIAPRYSNPRTLYRHQAAVRQYLQVTPFYSSDGLAVTEQIARDCAVVLEQRVDLINAMLDELIQRGYELPAYSTLNNLAETALASAQEVTFNLVVTRAPIEVIYKLRELLETDFGRRQSDFNTLKQAPKKPSRKHLEVLIDHLAWLESFGNLDAIFEGIVDTKIRHFAAQAAASDVSELKDCSLPKRYTLMLALIYRMRVRTRDHLAEMFIRRISTIHKRAKEELEQIQARQRQKLEQLAATLDGVVQILVQEPDDQEAGSLIREYLSPDGNLDRLRETCAEVQATGGNNYLPLIWKHFRSHRSLLFRLSHLLQLEPTTQDRSLTQALQLIQDNENLHREWIDEFVDLSFASERWVKVVRRPASEGPPTNRRYLEVCVFSYLASELRSGDMCVQGSESFADYRKQLLPWEECLQRLPAYCEKMGLPGTAKEFVASLKAQLEETADGTQFDFYDDNLLAGYHFRYRKMGAVAYRHVA